MKKLSPLVSTAYVLRNARILTGNPGEILSGHDLIVKDGVIAGVRETALTGKSEASAYPVQDLSGRTILPRLIDAHVHLAGCRTTSEDQELGGFPENRLARAIRSVADARALLEHGFTSVRDISWNGLYLKRIIGEGTITGPRIVACGPGLSRTGGHGDLYQLPLSTVRDNHFWTFLADGPDEIRRAVRFLLREGADQIKLWASGGDNYPIDRITDTHYTLEEMETAVREARMIEGTLVCAHCESTGSIRDAVLAGADTIEHGEALDEETADLMAEKGCILVPTLRLLLNWRRDFAFDPPAPGAGEGRTFSKPPHVSFQRDLLKKPPTEEEEREAVIRNLALARSKGIPIALGSDTVFEPVTRYGAYSAGELTALVQCGMTPLEALYSATAVSAAALGMNHILGTLEPGKIADLLVVSGNPDEDISLLADPARIEWVVQSGGIVAGKGRLVV